MGLFQHMGEGVDAHAAPGRLTFGIHVSKIPAGTTERPRWNTVQEFMQSFQGLVPSHGFRLERRLKCADRPNIVKPLELFRGGCRVIENSGSSFILPQSGE